MQGQGRGPKALEGPHLPRGLNEMCPVTEPPSLVESGLCSAVDLEAGLPAAADFSCRPLPPTRPLRPEGPGSASRAGWIPAPSSYKLSGLEQVIASLGLSFPLAAPSMGGVS